MYTVERNHCQCHPETCNCPDWVIMHDNKLFVRVFNKEKTYIIANAMNAKKQTVAPGAKNRRI